jgi:hypothetical protein
LKNERESFKRRYGVCLQLYWFVMLSISSDVCLYIIYFI